MDMKFIKGIMIGGLITTGLVMMYADSGMWDKKTMMKKGKKMAKKQELCNSKMGRQRQFLFTHFKISIKNKKTIYYILNS